MQTDAPVRLSGEGLLSNIGSHHDLLMTGLRDQTGIIVDLTDISDVDVSFIQLLVSASRTAARQGKSFQICGMTDPVGTSFKAAGLDPARLNTATAGL